MLVAISPLGWGLIALALVCGLRALRDKNWPHVTWCFLAWPLMMSGAVIAWRQQHRHNPADPRSASASMGLNLLMALFAGGLTGIYLNRSSRAATTTVLCLGSFLFLGCSFAAAQAVTGSWL